MRVLIDVLKALPILIRLVSNVWEYLNRVSHGQPEQLLVELHAISEELKGATSHEERTAVARRISNLWSSGGVPEPGAGPGP